MSKKKKLILQISILVVVVLAVAGYFVFIEKIFAPSDPSKLSEKEIKQAQELLEFKNMDENLSSEQEDNYFKTFLDARTYILEHPETFNSNAWLTLARIKKYVKDYAGAEDIYLFVIEKNPINYVPEGNLADLYANYLYDYNQAVEHFWQAIKKTNLNYEMALAYYRNMADIYAVKLVNKSSEFEKRTQEFLANEQADYANNIDWLTTIAKYYKNIGDKQKALNYLVQALFLDPNNQAIQDEIEYLKQ